MAANVSGSVLSSIFFEHINSPGDQEGILLGEIVNHRTDVISDSQINNFKEEINTNIHSYKPCKGLSSFYNKRGHVDEEKLANMLKGKFKDAIGWYRFRRNSTMTPSLREHAVHRQLSRTFPGFAQQDFMFCLFTATTTSNISTHSFDHVFLTFNGSTFQPKEVSVINLGDTAQSDYKLQAKNTLSDKEGLYRDTVLDYESEFVEPPGRMRQDVAVDNMNSSIHHKLKSLGDGVLETEKQVYLLSLEVDLLRSKLHKKQEESKEKAEPLVYSTNKVKNQTFCTELLIDLDMQEVKAVPILQPSLPHAQVKTETSTIKAAPDLKPVVVDTLLDSGDVEMVTASVDRPSERVSPAPVVESLPEQPVRSQSDLFLSQKTVHEPPKSSKPADAFAFIDDMLSSAKAPTLTSRKSASLPRSVGQLKKDFGDDYVFSNQGTAALSTTVSKVKGQGLENDSKRRTRSAAAGVVKEEYEINLKDDRLAPPVNEKMETNHTEDCFEVSNSPTF